MKGQPILHFARRQLPSLKNREALVFLISVKRKRMNFLWKSNRKLNWAIKRYHLAGEAGVAEQGFPEPRLDHVRVDASLAAHDRQYAAVELRGVEQTRSRAQPRRLKSVRPSYPVGRRRPPHISSVLIYVPCLLYLKRSSHRKSQDQSACLQFKRLRPEK